MSYFKGEHYNWGTNDFHCEDCGDITPHYVKRTKDPKCPDCREVHTLLNTRCKHGMIEIMCGICMGDVKVPTRAAPGHGCWIPMTHDSLFGLYMIMGGTSDPIMNERGFAC